MPGRTGEEASLRALESHCRSENTILRNKPKPSATWEGGGGGLSILNGALEALGSKHQKFLLHLNASQNSIAHN